MIEKLGFIVGQLILDHIEWFGALIVAWLLGSVIITILTALYPNFATRPQWARACIALEPFFANIWRLVIAMFGPVGIKLKSPFGDKETP